MRKIFLIFSLLNISLFHGQDLNCEITIDARQTGQENLQVFKSLENQLNEFVNNNSWSARSVRPNEKINCAIFLSISSMDNDSFNGTLQIQASRPVYNSSYFSPVYNFNDKNFNFRYQEYQNLNFNPNQFENNLVSIITFHIYMILGIDADSFSLNGGTDYFEVAREILDYSQNQGYKGWASSDGLQSRYFLIDNILSPTYKEYREVMYSYHLRGLDKMADEPKMSKTILIEQMNALNIMHRRRPNSFLMRVFFDTKSDEIFEIFKDGPKVSTSNLISILNRISPNHSEKWRNIN
tara:strand:- start:787 stop:1671 length:885 start_codon:yes stop_codon:yes gene_type:complete